MPNISKSPQAFVDLDELVSYIQRGNPEAARRFLNSAEWTFNLLAAMPQMGKEYTHPRHEDLRVWYVRRPFRNYKIFYQINAMHAKPSKHFRGLDAVDFS